MARKSETAAERFKRAAKIDRVVEVAQRIGCSPARVYQLFHGGKPSMTLAGSIERHYGVPMQLWGAK